MLGTLIASWLDVRSMPVRTLVAVAGMIAAITAVVVVDAAASLSHAANTEYLESTYGRSATVRIAPSAAADGSNAEARQASAQQLVQTLAENGVSLLSVFDQLNISIVGNGAVITPSQSVWVSSDIVEIISVVPIFGTIPNETATSFAPHLVISTGLAQRLGLAVEQAAGSGIQYTNEFTGDLKTTTTFPAIIDAVATQIGTSSNPLDALFVSDLDRPVFAPHGAETWLAYVRPQDVDLVIELAERVSAPGSDQPAFESIRVDQGAELAPVLNQQQVTARAVTLVALIVGGLGILNSGLGAVRERGREFGLRRALGASKRMIFTGVIAQALFEVLFAAAVAIPLAALIVRMFDRTLVLDQLPLPASTDLPAASAAKGIIAAVGVGTISALLPAQRASRASVVQALRD